MGLIVCFILYIYKRRNQKKDSDAIHVQISSPSSEVEGIEMEQTTETVMAVMPMSPSSDEFKSVLVTPGDGKGDEDVSESEPDLDESEEDDDEDNEDEEDEEIYNEEKVTTALSTGG